MVKDDSCDQPGVRLQKVLAQAGLGSRRKCEEMIDQGRVEVNGELICSQGRRVDPEHDIIRVDGARIPSARRHIYLALNKPRGVVSSMEDPQGRPDLRQYQPRNMRLFHVGRLDSDTEGLIILTNDGDFAQKLSHPRHEIDKVYVVECEGLLDNAALSRLSKGVVLDDGPIRPDKVVLMHRAQSRSMVRVFLHSGRNRIVRRLFDALGHPVIKLARIAIGPVKLGQLPPGQTRELNAQELGSLLDIADRYTQKSSSR